MFKKWKLVILYCDIIFRCLVYEMSYFNGFAGSHLDLALWLSYLDLIKQVEHKVERHLCFWGVKEVRIIKNTKQNLEVIITGIRKCVCSFRLWSKPINNGES